MTECNQSEFEFEAHFSRRVVAQFDGQQTSTEGGALLLRATDRKIGLLRRVAGCFTDTRDPKRIEHPLDELLAQRIYALALGYEDLNDHEELRRDPLLALLAGQREIGEPLAGKSTLNRLELAPANQLRLYFSSLAYVLVDALRRLALSGTDWATAQVGTIRLRLLKVAAEVRFTARRIRVRYSSAYPWKHFFAAAWQALRC